TLKWLERKWFFKVFTKIIRVIVYDNNIEQVGRIYQSGATLGQGVDLTDGKTIEVDYLGGCNMSFKRKIFKEIGLFDENFIGKSQYFEADFCLRIKEHGYKVLFNPRARVQHIRRNRHGFPRDYIRNFIYFYFKNLRPKRVS
ncbi:unnamed protein product, partial [marine sediment metagenome]